MPVINPFDADFDAAWTRVRDALAASNPEGITMEAARERLREVMLRTAGENAYDAAANDVPAASPATSQRRALVVPRPGTPTWWDDPTQAEVIDHYIRTRRALGNAFRGGLLITGPAGSGKTEGVAHAVERLRATTPVGYTKMDCATVTDVGKWFGRREIDAAGTRYEKSDFILAMERGDVILLDEINRLHASIHNGVMAFLDGSNSVHLSDLNVTVERHPQTVILATANIGAQYGGTYRMDWAMRERFPFVIERGWPPREREIGILTSATGCDGEAAANLVTIAERTRRMYETGDLRSPISTRTLVAAAWWVASGMTEAEALELTAIGLYDPDASGIAGKSSERQQVRAIVAGKGVA